MNPVLLHIYGPLSIHAYGLLIAIGGLICFILLYKDQKLQKIASESTITTAFQILLFSLYFGGKIGCILSEPIAIKDYLCIFKFWEPGLSILGAIISCLLSLTIYFHIKRIPILSLLDRFTLYAPIAQSFGRLGCYFAGCCYGLPTTCWLSVTYTNPAHMAPLYCALHPAQLYSSIVLMGIFLFLYFVHQHRNLKTGMLTFSYIVLISAERFLIDFIRWDRIFIAEPSFLQIFSVHQWIAVAMCVLATIGIIILHNRKS